MGYFALILVVVHRLFLPIKGWLAQGRWTPGLPPISLLAVLAALVSPVARLRVGVTRRSTE